MIFLHIDIVLLAEICDGLHQCIESAIPIKKQGDNITIMFPSAIVMKGTVVIDDT
jgi:hypothetical protein